MSISGGSSDGSVSLVRDIYSKFTFYSGVATRSNLPRSQIAPEGSFTSEGACKVGTAAVW